MEGRIRMMEKRVRRVMEEGGRGMKKEGGREKEVV